MTNGSVANGEKVNLVIRALSFLLRRRRFTVSFLAEVYYVKLLCNGRAFIACSYWVEITFWRQCRMQLLLQYVQEFLVPGEIERMISLIIYNLKFSMCAMLGTLSHYFIFHTPSAFHINCPQGSAIINYDLNIKVLIWTVFPGFILSINW